MRLKIGALALVVFFLWLAMPPLAGAEDGEDLDVYKWRMTSAWWFSSPTGSFAGKANSGTFGLNRDFGFGSYSTFTGTADWRIKRKHHLLFSISPVSNSQTNTLSRTIEFQGVTYDVGASVASNIKARAFAPGYQYDIIRRNRISFSIATQVYLMSTTADLTGTRPSMAMANPKPLRDQSSPPCPYSAHASGGIPCTAGDWRLTVAFKGCHSLATATSCRREARAR